MTTGGSAGPVRRLSSPDGTLEAEVLPAIGARLHRLRAFGVDVLRTPGDPATHGDEPFFWGAYPMAPWCNRLETGSVRIGTRTLRLEPNFRDGTAIHGQVSARPWAEEGAGAYRVRAGGDAWPWPYEVSMRYDLADSAFEVALLLTNLADEPMPGGLGLHPWFARPVEVAIHGRSVYASNLDHQRAPEPVTGQFALDELAPLPAGLDATWTNLRQPPVELRWPQHGLRGTLTFTAPSRCVAAANPDDLDAVAVEPETHAPQGLRRLLANEPDGLRWLDPGGSLALTIVLRVDQEPDSTRRSARKV